MREVFSNANDIYLSNDILSHEPLLQASSRPTLRIRIRSIFALTLSPRLNVFDCNLNYNNSYLIFNKWHSIHKTIQMARYTVPKAGISGANFCSLMYINCRYHNYLATIHIIKRFFLIMQKISSTYLKT